MLDKIFKKQETIFKISNSVKLCNINYYLPWEWNQLNELYEKNNNSLPENTIGIDWFNGAKESVKYITELENRLYKFKIKCYLDRHVIKYIQDKCIELLNYKRKYIRDYINIINFNTNDHIFYNRVQNNKYSYNNKNEEIDISIVMVGTNRTKQILCTLKTIEMSNICKNKIQVILVDDSDTDIIDKNALSDFNFKIDCIKINQMNKVWINPVVNYNIGFKYIKGRFVVIQNAEVCHIGNFLNYVYCNVDDEYYIYDVKATKNFEANDYLQNNINLTKTIKIYENNNIFAPVEYAWYQSKKNNHKMHFLASMTKKTLDKIKNFSYDYAFGTSYDDNDFLLKIVSKNIKTKSIHHDNNIGGIHQYHSESLSLENNISNKDVYMTKESIYHNEGKYIDFFEDNIDSSIIKIYQNN